MDATEALAVLGVRAGMDLAGIRSAYRDLVREAHPDLVPDDEAAHARTARLTEAYEVLRAFVETHGSVPPPSGASDSPAARDQPAGRVQVDQQEGPAADEALLTVPLPASEAYGALYEAASQVGEVSYVDRRLGILEIIVRFEGGPSCSVMMTLTCHEHDGDAPDRSHRTEVLCSMESIESAPTPPLAPVIDALVVALGGH